MSGRPRSRLRASGTARPSAVRDRPGALAAPSAGARRRARPRGRPSWSRPSAYGPRSGAERAHAPIGHHGPVSGLLVLAATPIGRPEDASARLARGAGHRRRRRRRGHPPAAPPDRRPRASRSTGRVVSYFEGNEAARTAGLVEDLVAGRRVLLVTDAGMPSVSDPGYRLVAAAVEAGVRVTAVPGPERRAHRAGRLRAAGGPVLLRGLPAAQVGRARPTAARARRRAAHAGVLRVPAPHRGLAGGAGRGVRRRPARRGVPRADQDPRGGRPRPAGRAGRLGRRRGARRGHAGGRRAHRPGAGAVDAGDHEALRALVAAEEQAGAHAQGGGADASRERTGVPRRQVYDAAHRVAHGPARPDLDRPDPTQE